MDWLGILQPVATLILALVALGLLIALAMKTGEQKGRQEPLEDQVDEMDEAARNRARNPGMQRFRAWLRSLLPK